MDGVNRYSDSSKAEIYNNLSSTFKKGRMGQEEIYKFAQEVCHIAAGGVLSQKNSLPNSSLKKKYKLKINKQTLATFKILTRNNDGNDTVSTHNPFGKGYTLILKHDLYDSLVNSDSSNSRKNIAAVVSSIAALLHGTLSIVVMDNPVVLLSRIIKEVGKSCVAAEVRNLTGEERRTFIAKQVSKSLNVPAEIVASLVWTIAVAVNKSGDPVMIADSLAGRSAKKLFNVSLVDAHRTNRQILHP